MATPALRPDEAALLEEVSPERLMQDVHAIARWVRLSGSPEEREAFAYLRNTLDGLGLRTELLLHDAYISLPGPARLEVEGGVQPADGAPYPCITHAFAAATPPEGLAAEAVYAGTGTPEELSAARVAGKIVVQDGLAVPQRVRDAEAAGAVGHVFLNADPYVHEMIVSPVWGNPTPETLPLLPRRPAVSLAGEAAARLRGRLAGPGPVRLRITAAVETGWRRIPLLVADLPGRADDSYVLFAGHVDSWHRGAMDNGAANAVMLEVARLLARRPRYRGLKLAFWSGHSHGRYAGSAWFCDRFWDDLDRRCAAHVYVDSVGGMGAEVATEAFAMPETRGVAAAVIAAVAGVEFTGGRVGRSGDQSFLGIGIPSLLMTVSEQPAGGPHASRDFSLRTGGRGSAGPTSGGAPGSGGLGWWWHTTEDTPDKIDPRNLARDCRIYLGCVYRLCASPVLPLDYRAAARAFLADLAQYARVAGRFSLAECLDEARRLVDAAERLHAAIERLGLEPGRPDARERVAAANRTLMALGRALIPAAYTGAGRFHPDPALEASPIPAVAGVTRLAALDPASDAARFLATQLVRGRSLVRDALRRAAQVAEDGIAALTR